MGHLLSSAILGTAEVSLISADSGMLATTNSRISRPSSSAKDRSVDREMFLSFLCSS